MPPTATRPNNQTLIAANGHEATPAIMQPSRSHHAAIIQPSCSHHAAIMQPSCSRQTTNTSLPPTAPPSNHLAPAKLNFNWGYKSIPGVSSSPTSCSLNRHNPIKSFGTRQIELQLGLQEHTWRFIIADIMQSQPPHAAAKSHDLHDTILTISLTRGRYVVTSRLSYLSICQSLFTFLIM